MKAYVFASALIPMAALLAQADDECVGATPVGVSRTLFSNVGYTHSPDPWSCGAVPFDRWFVFVPAVSMPFTISACNIGQRVDTVIEVYEGACGQLAFVACSNDRCGHFGVGDEVRATLNAGRTYHIRVGIFTGDGSFLLDISPGPGSIALSIASGCGAASTSFRGIPAIGSFFTTSVENVTGAPFVGVGLVPGQYLFCTCTVGHDWSLLRPGTSVTLPIPPDPGLLGLPFYVQGADVGAVTGCAGAALGLTDTWRVTIGS
jgi:hypothetical protein